MRRSRLLKMMKRKMTIIRKRKHGGKNPRKRIKDWTEPIENDYTQDRTALQTMTYTQLIQGIHGHQPCIFK